MGRQYLRSARAVIFRRYQEERYPSLRWRTRRYDGFPAVELSNAYVLANQTYVGDLPCFELALAGCTTAIVCDQAAARVALDAARKRQGGGRAGGGRRGT